MRQKAEDIRQRRQQIDPAERQTVAFAPPHVPAEEAKLQRAWIVPKEEAPEVVVEEKQGINLGREIAETILLMLLLFWVVNFFTGRFKIDGQSMDPTMQSGEYIIVNKFAYRFGEPERGEIIVLHAPRNPNRDFIKRVIGIPGDTIVIENQTVSVNGVVIDEPYILAPPTYSGTWTVPEGEYYVLGDNRNNSSDSHQWGFLPEANIVGRGEFVYWPVREMARVPHVDHGIIPTLP